jgi:hypothetical protein
MHAQRMNYRAASPATYEAIAFGLINLWNRIGVGFRLQHPK